MEENFKEQGFYTKENYVKLYEDKDYMSRLWLQENYRAKDIANELHISVKLVHIWLKKHGLL